MKHQQVVEQRGGNVFQPKHPIVLYGFRAIILDFEGNRIASRLPSA